MTKVSGRTTTHTIPPTNKYIGIIRSAGHSPSPPDPMKKDSSSLNKDYLLTRANATARTHLTF